MHFLSGEKIKLGSVKRRRGWNQIWGLLAVILCLIASLNRMSTGTCPDRSRQLVKTHEFSTAQKVMFPSSLCSLKVVVLYVCYFSLQEHAEREGGREHVCVCVCVCHYGPSHLCGIRWENSILVSVIMSESLSDRFSVDVEYVRWGVLASQQACTFSSVAWLFEFWFVSESLVLA